MNAEQKAIIAAAEKEGLSPCEKDARLVVHDMVNATRKAMQKYQVGYNKMTEQQQDAVLGDLEESYKSLALTIARTIASGGTPAISMTLKDMKISNGTVTGIVDGSDKHFNDLISKVQDKSEVMVVLFERQYADAMDNIQADKDQRSLGLDDEPKKPAGKKERASASTGSATSAAALAKTATDLPPKLLEDARAFIDNQQVVTVSGMQNHLKIGAVKAGAVLEQMEAEGRVKFVGDSKSGEYQKVHTVKTDPADKMINDLTFDGDDNPITPEVEQLLNQNVELSPIELTEELVAKIKDRILTTKKISVGDLSIAFDIDADLAEEALERLELEGVISPESDMGIRTITEDE